MPPAWVLLDRYVDISLPEETAAAAAKSKGVVLTIPYLREATIQFLASMELDTTLLLPPPNIATLRLRCPMSSSCLINLDDVATGSVACTDKSLLVLYGGMYCGPGSNVRGCYLIFDAAAAAAPSTVPPPPNAAYLTGIGAGAVVLRRHLPSSSYLLAELASTPKRGFAGGELHLWCSDSPTPQWSKTAVRLPREVSPAPAGKHRFFSDASFSFGGSCLCWVDLLHGIVVCADPQDHRPQLRFVPLPEGCPAVDTTDYPYRPRMYEYRYAGVVGGVIKLVSIVGLLEGWDIDEFKLSSWTLSPDLDQWTKGPEFHLKHLWASDEYQALKLRKYTPICPVLSPQEDGVVYAVVTDVEVQNIFRGFKVVNTKVDIKRQYVLGLDMHRSKILSTTSGIPASNVNLFPTLLATDFCACLQQGAKDRQREVEASDFGDSTKRVKFEL